MSEKKGDILNINKNVSEENSARRRMFFNILYNF